MLVGNYDIKPSTDEPLLFLSLFCAERSEGGVIPLLVLGWTALGRVTLGIG